MRLLMITRKVDKGDHLAGFIYSWVAELAKHVDELHVISWQEGDSSGLPENTHVHHLPTRAHPIKKIFLFEQQLLQLLPNVDGVFCHQMPIYTILAAPLARLYKKYIVSWYTHRSTDWRMRLMTMLTNKVVTASAESFRLASKRVMVIGHGIDIEAFKPATHDARKPGSLITVGRISPTKDYESMILAVDDLVKQGNKDVTLAIVGAPGLAAHETYLQALQRMVATRGLQSRVTFAGPQPNAALTPLLRQAEIFINLSGTGSVDKAVLEAMACSCVVVTSNEAFAAMLPPECIAPKNNPAALAQHLRMLLEKSPNERRELGARLRTIVVEQHALSALMTKIVAVYATSANR
jgi:glycosyltransferase involved in cell wall biosynthesis